MSESRARTYRANQDNPDAVGLERRHFLRIALAGAAGLVLSQPAGSVWARQTRARTPGRWSDPRTWGGSMPGPRDVAIIDSDVVLDTDARVAGVVVEPGAVLTFLGERAITLKSSGNVIVRGRLSMHPKEWSLVHRMIFVDVDEDAFAGEGMKVLDSDVGLWVMGNGMLDLAGSRKLAWTRTVSGVPADATSIELREYPRGWHVGDRIVLTPTGSPASRNFNRAYDQATIKSISGRTVTLTKPTRFAHPAVEVKRGTSLTPEVLNLTRNVRIEGTRKGRAHVFIHSGRRQRIERVSLRYMGPRQHHQGRSVGVRGRYPLHFHECGRASDGSLVKGTVVAASGNHAFVPHNSNGITFAGCISHDSMEDPYWWDSPPDGAKGPMIPLSHAIVWDRCVASLVRADPKDTAEDRLSGFTLAAGNRNVVRHCVAVGVQDGADSSGFFWRAPGEPAAAWEFNHNVAHNNKSHGSFNWQNDRDVGTARRFVAYHNGALGVSQGAYRNPYRFENAILYGNALAAIKLHAVSRHVPLRFSDSVFDGAGLSDYLVVTDDHKIPAGVPTEFVRCMFKGYRHAAVWIAEDRNGKGVPNWIDLINCTYEGNEFYLHPNAAPGTRLRVRDRAHDRITVQRWDRPGMPRRRWNASVRPGWRS
jgi:hypothetical protein